MSHEVGISRIHFPITALGPGRRVGIWFQGCTIRCAGCMSRDTWAAARRKTTVARLMERILPWLDEAAGVTISGGEPFEQPDALLELIREIGAMRDVSLLVYSGYAFDYLQERHPAILGEIDVLVSEPFDADKAVSIPLMGSANQRATGLTERGKALVLQAEADWRQSGGKLDLITEADGSLWMAWVPGPGDLERLGRRLGGVGVRAMTSAGRLGEGV